MTGFDASGEHVVYVLTVTTGDASTQIGKRYSSFAALHESLCRAHYRSVPSLPTKFHPFCDARNESLCRERQRGLHAFLAGCFHHPAIAESVEFVSFLVPAFQQLWQAAHGLEFAKLEAANARLAEDLDEARIDDEVLGNALARALSNAAAERAMRRALAVWSRAAGAAKLEAVVALKKVQPDSSRMLPPAARAGWNTLRANPPSKQELGSLRPAGSRPPLRARTLASVADVKREEKSKKSHAAVSLAASLGLGASQKGLGELRFVRTLSTAGSVLGDNSSAKLDPENQSLSGFSMI